MTTSPGITTAFPGIAPLATSYVIDYTDRAGEHRSATYSGDDAFRRAKKGVAVVRSQHATAITVTGTWATGTQTAALDD